ncbi:CesT family type III secretion system chaperone [Salmonella enterica subsp. salamae]|nr:CesT family type III secretion system chaperone [Salmonella enterica subsp. salamae]ECJ2280395.1 CesT family type III secretion system chaperone [Salmonella enterica subsp. salamae]HCC0888452.1 CesT family type III secretion system chaperone [Salmonella enterica]
MASRAELLLKNFADKNAIKTIAFNENRLCSFKIDNIYYVSLSDVSDDYMMIYGICGKFPLDSNNFALEVLNANLWFAEKGGPHLCYESGSQSLMLAARFPLDGSTSEKLEHAIEAVVKAMESLFRVLDSQGIILENYSM